MSHAPYYRSYIGSGLIIASGLAAAGVALYLYLQPLTGVTGSIGALIVLAASVAVAIGGMLTAITNAAAWRWLTTLVILGTALAAFFLHGWWIMLAMLVAFVGLVLHAIANPRRHQRGMA